MWSSTLTRIVRVVFITCTLLVITTGCEASRITGTYVTHGQSIVQMLSLTQSDNQHFSGVLSYVEVDTQGHLKSEQVSVTGVIDADQLTLTLNSFLSPIFGGKNLSGTLKGNSLALQEVGSQGRISSWAFTRSSPDEFKAYADQLRSKGATIVASEELSKEAYEIGILAGRAESWMSSAKSHSQKIPNVRSYYQQIDDKMAALVKRERGTFNSVAKSQIAVAVDQGALAGDQLDMNVDQVWDYSVANAGTDINRALSKWAEDCGTKQVPRRGSPSTEAAQAWESACKQAVAEREKFVPVFQEIMEQRASLKSFQAAEKAKRADMVQASQRIAIRF